MGTTRWKGGQAVPWIALLIVTAFAIVLLARRESPASAARPTADGASPPASGPATTAAPAPAAAPAPRDAAAIEKAAAATEIEYDRVLQDLAQERQHAADLAQEAAASRARAESAEARRAAAEARLTAVDEAMGAAEAEVKDLRQALDAMGGRVEGLEARREAAEDPVRRWLKDAADPDPDHRQRAKRGAERAGEKDLAHLAELVSKDPAYAAPAATFLSWVEASDASDQATAAVLAAADATTDPKAIVAALGATPVARPAAVAPTLSNGGPALRRAVLDAVLQNAARVADDQKAAFAAPVEGLLASGEPDLVARAARLVGYLRLDGLAPKLVPLLGSDDAAVRAGAAYALSRVPDRASVDAEVKASLATLLAADSVEVRTAAVLLAEAVLGERVAFDPAAPADARARALDALRPRLP